jgi:membrane protease YdiL (CAAX protease family)
VNEYFHLSKYHLIVILLYLFVAPSLVVLGIFQLQYGFSSEHFGAVAAIVVCAIGVFFSYVPTTALSRSVLRPSILLPAFVYGLFFAIPEEIIFRGFIQGFLQMQTDLVSAVLLSSLIFGFAHVLNGARSFRIEGWNFKLAVGAFFVGIILGAIFALTNSLLISTLLHAVFVFYLRVLSLTYREHAQHRAR